jgi:hypothetical protein
LQKGILANRVPGLPDVGIGLILCDNNYSTGFSDEDEDW